MSMSASTPTTDFPPSGCIICADPDVGHGLLCNAHQGINALAAWVDEGLIGDWDPSCGAGSEYLNHRTMLVQPPVGPAAPEQVGWRDQLAVLVRRFGCWVGLDEGEGEGGRGADDGPRPPRDPWDAFPGW